MTFSEHIVSYALTGLLGLAIGLWIGFYFNSNKEVKVDEVTYIGYADKHQYWSDNFYYTTLNTQNKDRAIKDLEKANAKRFYDDNPQGILVELYYKEVQ